MSMRQCVEAISAVVPEIAGQLVFYPCAGGDFAEPLAIFGTHFCDFQFEDITYQFRHHDSIPLQQGRYEFLEKRLDGPANSRMRHVHDSFGHTYRLIDPALLTETYRDVLTGRQLVVKRRRGFGQYGLASLSDGSVGVFIHRGDSNGEGGGGTAYLANHPMRHPPLSNLFEQVRRVISATALVVTDGSNTSIMELGWTYGKQVEFDLHEAGEAFVALGCRWTCLVRIGDSRHGQTYIWKVERTDV